MDISKKEVINNFIKLFDLNCEDGSLILKIPNATKKNRSNLRKLHIDIHDFDIKSEIDYLKNSEFHDTIIYQPNYFEQLLFVAGEQDMPYWLDSAPIKDEINQFTYEISSPSTEYIVASFYELFKNTQPPSFFISFLHDQGIPSRGVFTGYAKYRLKRKLMDLFMYKQRRFERINLKESNEMDIDEETIISFREILREFFHDLRTIKITSKNEKELKIFKKLSDAFLFSVGYNLSSPLMEFRYRKNHNIPFRRASYEEILPPRRIYNKKLLYYYQQALSTQNPVLQYFSFYQIIEYFYYQASTEKLIEEVKSTITSPDFSYQKTDSIEKVIIQVKNDTFGERKAIDLVFDKYVNEEDLRDKLIKYDLNYYESLKKNGVQFAEAKPISENKVKNNKIVINLSALGKRVYDVRNSLIHSKEKDFLFPDSKKGIYIPFTDHEEELRNEIPLIRLIAEQIMINSSKELNDRNLNDTFE